MDRKIAINADNDLLFRNGLQQPTKKPADESDEGKDVINEANASSEKIEYFTE